MSVCPVLRRVRHLSSGVHHLVRSTVAEGSQIGSLQRHELRLLQSRLGRHPMRAVGERFAALIPHVNRWTTEVEWSNDGFAAVDTAGSTMPGTLRRRCCSFSAFLSAL
jgi:hypothetical protein